MSAPFDDQICFFDDDSAAPNLKILRPEKWVDSQDLMQQCGSFTTKLTSFQGMISEIMTVIQKLGEKIEEEKLRATGMRMKVEGETEHRDRKVDELKDQVKEKQGELDRYLAELQSLEAAMRDQKKLIRKLDNGGEE